MNAFEPPKANLEHADPAVWDARIEAVRAGQRTMIAALAINIVITIAAMTPLGAANRSGTNVGFYVLFAGYLVYLALSIWGCAKIMRARGDWLLVIIPLCGAMIIPQFGLLIMIIMSMRATHVLREAGYKVGFFGAKALPPSARLPHGS